MFECCMTKTCTKRVKIPKLFGKLHTNFENRRTFVMRNHNARNSDGIPRRPVVRHDHLVQKNWINVSIEKI